MTVKNHPGRLAAAVVAASMVGHSLVLFPQPAHFAASAYKAAADSVSSSYREYKVGRDRAELVGTARKQLEEGKLELGRFILKANEIDSYEEGVNFDAKKAGVAYEKYLADLAYGISSGKRPQKSLSDTLKGLSYFGVPGGRMGDAINEGGGSCVQLSHLAASLMYDAGYKDRTHIRLYGPGDNGVGHMAPVFQENLREYDLVSGVLSNMSGTRIAPSDLVEAYARAHGLAPPLLEETGRLAKGANGMLPEGRPDGFSYPAAKGKASVDAPLFSSNAVREFNPDFKPSGKESRKGLRNTTFVMLRQVSGRFINPTSAGLLPSGTPQDTVRVHREAGDGDRLKSVSDLIEDALGILASPEGGKPRVKTALLGQLAALYFEAGWELALLGRHSIAETVKKQCGRMREMGKDSIAKLTQEDAKDPPWEVVYLGRDGQQMVIDSLRYGWSGGKAHGLALLAAFEGTREVAIANIERRGKIEQAEVIMNLKNGGDGPEIEGSFEFIRAYNAYSAALDKLRKDGFKAHRSVGGMMNIGEGLPVNDIILRLEGVQEGKAVIAAVGTTGVVLARDIIGLNPKHITYAGRTVVISAYGAEISAVAGTSSAWLDAFTDSFGQEYRKASEAVRQELVSAGMSLEWVDPLASVIMVER